MLTRLIAAPVVRVARLSLAEKASTLPIPNGPPRAHAPGPNGARILVVGNGIALGAGVRDHDLALPGALARAVSARTGRGVDVDLAAGSRMNLPKIAAAAREHHLARYDAIVVVGGSDEVLELGSLTRWRRQLTQLLAELREMVPRSATIVVAGVPTMQSSRDLPGPLARMADARSAELDSISREVCESTPATRFAPLSPVRNPTGVVLPPSDQYTAWSDALAAVVAREIAPAARDHATSLLEAGEAEEAEEAEAHRQATVDRLGLGRSAADPRLHRIVEITRRAFGTETALFTVLDRDIQRHVGRVGTEMTELPRRHSFCHFAVLEPGGMLVEDAREDPRFRDNPLVIGEPHIRFYAGFPVDAPDGERVGALCIFDPEPRSADEIDVALLRELAHLVQNELWRYLPETASGPRLRSLARPWTLPHIPATSRAVAGRQNGA